MGSKEIKYKIVLRNIQSASNRNMRIQIKNWGEMYSLKLKCIRIEDILNINELSIQLKIQKEKGYTELEENRRK